MRLSYLAISFIVSAMLTASACFLSADVHGNEKAISWTGRYRDAQRGDDDLVIDEWEPGQLQVTIVQAGHLIDDDDYIDAGFLAEVNGSIATWSSVSKCPMTLKKTPEGIAVSDHCKGSRDHSGLHRHIP